MTNADAQQEHPRPHVLLTSETLREPPIRIRFHHIINYMTMINSWFSSGVVPTGHDEPEEAEVLPPWEYPKTDETAALLRANARKNAEIFVEQLLLEDVRRHEEHAYTVSVRDAFDRCVEEVGSEKVNEFLPTMATVMDTYISGAISAVEHRTIFDDPSKLRSHLADANGQAFDMFLSDIVETNRQNESALDESAQLADEEQAFNVLKSFLFEDSHARSFRQLFLTVVPPEHAPAARNAFVQFIDVFTSVNLARWKLKEMITENERMFAYVRDLFGDDIQPDAPGVRMMRNGFFLAFYTFMRRAWLHPDESLTFSSDPDAVCKSCRGGETGIGEHCNVTGMPDRINNDELVKDVMEEVRGLIQGHDHGFATSLVSVRDNSNNVSQITMPIRQMFHEDFRMIFMSIFGQRSYERNKEIEEKQKQAATQEDRA